MKREGDDVRSVDERKEGEIGKGVGGRRRRVVVGLDMWMSHHRTSTRKRVVFKSGRKVCGWVFELLECHRRR